MKTKMTMNDVPQPKSLEGKPVFWSAIRFIIGGALGAVAYFLIVKLSRELPNPTCYQIGIRTVIESSMIPAWILMEATLGSESRFYQHYIYGLSSIPYAILGALIALKVKKIVIFVVGVLIIFCLVLSLLLGIYSMLALCA